MPKLNTVSLCSTIRCLYGLKRQLEEQERSVKGLLRPVLNALEAGHKETFSTATIKRITKYWELSLHVVCDGLYKLAGKQLSSNEHRRIILLSIFGPLYDDLFDDGILSYEQIEAFTLEPELHVAASFEEHVVKQVYLELLELAPDRETVIRHLHQVFEWQKASLRQMNAAIGEEELYEITYRKSYHSILLYYSVLDHYPTKAMQEMIYPMAGLLQLTNDVFDVYKDIRGGIYTIPNLYLDFEQLQRRFMADVALFNHRLMHLPYLRRAKHVYGITIHALHAMGCIAMEQLKEVTRGISNTAELATLSRKDLVCDMDTLRNKVKWVKQVKYLVNYRAPVAQHVVNLQAALQP